MLFRSIPERTRWEIATKGLTGAYIAISNALKQALGQKKFEEFNGSLWYEAGKGAKVFADTLGLAAQDASDVERITHLLAKASMGRSLCSKLLKLPKTDVWERLLSVLGTRGGRSKASTWIPAA